MSFRVKKYFISTRRSFAMRSDGSCSNGRRMLTPIACDVPAPSLPAAMIPGPAPVTTIQSCAASAAATLRVWA
jgi:hypothetical protein